MFVAALAAMLTVHSSAAPAPKTTFAAAGDNALSTLLGVYYAGNGRWNECDTPGCSQSDSDWGSDSLTYTLYLRWQLAGDASIPPVMSALTAAAPTYPSPC